MISKEKKQAIMAEYARTDITKIIIPEEVC